MTAYEAYCIFTACRLHFTSDSYDCFKYHFKTPSTPERFDKRHDKYSFSKLGKQYSQEQLILLLGDTFFESPTIWVQEVLRPPQYQQHLLHQAFRDAFAHRFEEEFRSIITPNPNDLLLCTVGYPPLLVHYWQKRISIETLLALNSVMKFFPSWDRQIRDPIVWKTFYKQARKYQPFFTPNAETVKEVVRKVLRDNQ